MNPATRIFKFLVRYKQDHNGNSPSLREIGRECGITSTSMVRYYLKALQDQGLISLGRFHQPRSITISNSRWTYTGTYTGHANASPH